MAETKVYDTSNGEVVEIADADVARRLIQDIGTAVATANRASGQVIERIAEALKLKAWIGAGYGSWDAMVEGEGWEFRPATTADRAALAEVFRASGMSFRAIGKMIDASPQTVMRDTEGTTVPNGTVVGTDGVGRPATKPEARSGEAEDREDSEGGDVDDTSPDVTDPGEADARETPDGSVAVPPSPGSATNSKRSPLPDAALRAGVGLRKAVERVERVVADDRFSANKEQVTAHLDGHLTYAIQVLTDLAGSISTGPQEDQ